MSELKNIEWRRLGIEVAAIVVSILLAFGIDAWWDERTDQLAFDRNLQALEQEISQNLDNLQQILDDTDVSLSKLDSVFSVLADLESQELQNSFVDDVADAYFHYGPDTTTNAFEEVVAPANLRRIGNPTLRASIVRANESLKDVQANFDTLRQEYNDRQAPILAQHFVLSDFSWYDEVDVPAVQSQYDQLVEAGLLRPVPKSKFTVDDQAVRSKGFWNQLYVWYSLSLDYAASVQTAQRDLQESLDLLESEISQRQ